MHARVVRNSVIITLKELRSSGGKEEGEMHRCSGLVVACGRVVVVVEETYTCNVPLVVVETCNVPQVVVETCNVP